jgi:hypothetical protein
MGNENLILKDKLIGTYYDPHRLDKAENILIIRDEQGCRSIPPTRRLHLIKK